MTIQLLLFTEYLSSVRLTNLIITPTPNDGDITLIGYMRNRDSCRLSSLLLFWSKHNRQDSKPGVPGLETHALSLKNKGTAYCVVHLAV